MKKFLALLLTLTLLAGLTACKDTEAASTAQEQHTVTAPTNDATFVYQPDDPAATLPGGCLLYTSSYLAAYQLSSAANFAYTLLSNTAYPMSHAASVSSSGVSYSARMALYSAE